MADLRKQIDLVFRGVDETGQATQAALGNAAKFSQSVGNVTAPIADFTKSAVKFEASLLVAGAAVTAFAIKAAGDFDGAFREIATLLDEPIESLDGFRQAILDYAATSTQSLGEITTAVYSAISAGTDYTDSLGVVAQAEQLAIASKADLGDTLVLLVSSLNAYGAGVDEAESFSDALFTTVRQGQTTLPELASSLAQVTSIAAAGGIEFDELLAAVATLTASGLPTSQAITAIRGAISNIISPTAQARQLAEELGIEFGAQALQSRGLQGVLQDVAEATGGNVEQQSRLFGSVQGLTAVLSLGGESAEMFGNNLDAMSDKAGAVSAAFDKMADDIGLSNQRVLNAVQGLLISIGDPLLDAYGDVAAGIAAVFNAVGVQVSEGELGGLIGFIEEQLREAGRVLQQTAINIPEAFGIADLSGFEEGLRRVSEAIGGLFQGFDLTTPQGLANAIEGLARAFRVLSEFTASAIETFQWLFDAIASNNGNVLDLAERFAGFAGTIGGIATQIDAILPAFNALIGVLTALAGVKTATLIPALVNTASGFGALAATLAPGAALAVAIGGTVLVVGNLVSSIGELREANRRLVDAELGLDQAQGRRAERIQQIYRETGILLDINEDLVGQVRELGLVQDENTGKWRVATDEVRDFEAEVRDKLNEALRESGDYTEDLQRALMAAGLTAEQVGLSKPAEEAGAAAEGATEKTQRWIETTVDGVRTFTQVGGGVASSLGDVDQALEEVTQTSEEFRLKVLEIASQEYIATVRAQVELDIAALEAETARVEAAFDSINIAIESTGSLLSDLFGAFTSSSGLDQLFVQRQIEREEQRRQQAFDLQQQLTEAQIEALRERTRQMARGDALLTVDGAGLQPHLEAFMWEILRTIQVRVNEDGLDMLLGTQ